MALSDLDLMNMRKIKDLAFIKEGIISLESKKDVIICPADKGGGLVVMSKQFFKGEMCHLLEDTNTYKLLKSDPIFEFKEDLSLLIQKGLRHKVLTIKEAGYLDPSACRSPIISFLPKVHKNALQPPGRPIVNGIDLMSA